jgi:hypothetical protein
VILNIGDKKTKLLLSLAKDDPDPEIRSTAVGLLLAHVTGDERVLPALVPGMSYSEMEVAEGTQAGEAFLRMINPDLPKTERQILRRALLEYCGQDTRAMHEILRRF